MHVHDPDDELPEPGTRFRHDKREKTDVVGATPDMNVPTTTVPAYTIEVLEHAPEGKGGTELEMHHRVKVVDTSDPEFLEEGDTFLVTDDTLQGEKYTELDA